MKVLIVGGGGREHALAWKAAQSEDVEEVLVAPGNGGTATEPRLRNMPLDAGDNDALVELAARESVDLTIIGPEAPLVAGVVDAFRTAGLRCFGPDRAAAALEGSKTFTKEFLTRHGIPTARFGSFDALDAALDFISEFDDAPLVVKADGLAAGKGVVVAQTLDEARAAAETMLSGGRFGEAGRRIVVEEFLRGEEASFIVMCDGEHVMPLASSQDHKPRDDGDRGPNTGGMGAYSPAPVVDEALHRRIMDEIILPTVAGMAKEGRRYAGFLYAGLMVTPAGDPLVLEFNCRFGDPEAQPILMRMHGDLPALCLAALQGRLDEHRVAWEARAALGVVMASTGYPESTTRGEVISGLEESFDEDIKVFHAATVRADGQVLTAGGRVLCVTALGADVAAAQRFAYGAVRRISWPGAQYRTDIGHRAVARERERAGAAAGSRGARTG